MKCMPSGDSFAFMKSNFVTQTINLFPRLAKILRYAFRQTLPSRSGRNRLIADDLFAQLVGEPREGANLGIVACAAGSFGTLNQSVQVVELSLRIGQLSLISKCHKTISTTPLAAPARSVPKNDPTR